MKASLQILDAYGLLPLQSFQIPSKTERGLLYTVEQMREGWRCDCVAGLMKQPCRHVRIAQNQIDGKIYRPDDYKSVGEDVFGKETGD